jgi:hypothetical protein
MRFEPRSVAWIAGRKLAPFNSIGMSYPSAWRRGFDTANAAVYNYTKTARRDV